MKLFSGIGQGDRGILSAARGCACVSTALLLLVSRPGWAAPGADVAAPALGAKQCVQQALAAINARDGHTLAPLLTPGAAASFGWIRETTTRHWAGAALTAPGAETDKTTASQETARPLYLAIFHAWHTCQSDGDHVHPLTFTAQGWRLGPEIPETETGGFRVRDHDLHVSLDVAHQRADISDSVRIERTRPETSAYCLLRLNEGYVVQDLTAARRAIPFQQAGGVLLFAPPAGAAFTVRLRYSGVLNHDNGDYILRNEATLDSYWYPHIARLPATATITATAPPEWTPLAQGEPMRRERGPDGAITITYRNDLPVSYFTIDMGQYHLTTRQAEGRHLTAYLLRDDPGFANRCLDLLASALHFYDANFARFPYTRYGLVETRGPFDGALEAYSFATFAARGMVENIPHELSHTWWGGLVPCTYTHSMWDESFADYSDHLYHRLAGSTRTDGKAQQTPHLSYGNRYNAFPLATAYDTSDNKQAQVGYEKGSLVLRALEEELGRDQMLRCISAFISGHPRGEAADWPEFEQAVNRVTGQDYGWFFRQWIDRAGLPSVRLQGTVVRREGNQYAVEGDIVQPDTPYRLRVPLLLRTQGGGEADTEVQVSGAVTHFRLLARSVPAKLVLDPDNSLPLANAAGTILDFAEIGQ